MSLLLVLLCEAELVVPLVIQTLPPSLFTLTFPPPLMLFAVCPGFLPLLLASRFFASWDPLVSGDDSWAGHPSVGCFQHPISVDVKG